MPSPFATATEFCEFTGLSMPDDLSRIQSVLDMSSSMIRRYLDQDVSVVTDEIEVFQETDRDWLLLTQRPVTAITALAVNAVAFTDYRFERWGQVFTTTGVDWTDGATITYTHGYTETESEFIAVKHVCIEAARRVYSFDDRNAAVAQGAFPMETIGFATGLFLTDGEMNQLRDLGKVGVG